jgi:hypothetical protein
MEYVRSSLPVIVNQFSPPDAGHLLYLTGKLVGMQFYPDIAASFPATHDSGPQGFGALLLEFLHAEGDDADSNQSNGCVTISQAMGIDRRRSRLSSNVPAGAARIDRGPDDRP